MNEIPRTQNSDEAMRLMRARQEVWAEASDLLKLQIVLTVGVPVVGALIGLFVNEAKPYVAALALVIMLVDAVVLDRTQRSRLKTAARIAEHFDCKVLELQPNAFLAGRAVDPEVVSSASDAWLRRKGSDAEQRDWYPPVVGVAPLHMARVICQRTNLWYDAALRRRYGIMLLTVAGALTFAFFTIAMISGWTVESLVVNFLAPAAPVLTWSLREFFRQTDTADAQVLLKGQAEALWDEVREGSCDPVTCTARSRAFQDAIFNRRTLSPLIFPGIYQVLRPGLELQMNQGAEEMLREAGFAV